MHKDFNGKQNQYCSLLTCCQNSDTMVIDSNDCLSFAKGNILRKKRTSFFTIKKYILLGESSFLPVNSCSFLHKTLF